jgi:hypothetical protein
MTRSTTPFALCGLLAALTIGLTAVLTTSCKQDTRCKDLGNCGGPLPLGRWELSPGHGSCSEDLYTAPTDTRLVQADLPAARTPPPEPALFDWCYLLVTNGGTNIQAKPPRFYYENGPVGAAQVQYEADGHYSVGITKTGTYTLDFPAVCMREFGAMDNRPAVPGGPPVNICKQLEVPLAASGLGEGSYRNTSCDPNPADPGGCLCVFDVSEAGGGAGTYQLLNNNTILHLPFTNFPQRVTFCNKGDSLELTGANGDYLFGVRGLRTMTLSRAAAAAPPSSDAGTPPSSDAGMGAD